MCKAQRVETRDYRAASVSKPQKFGIGSCSFTLLIALIPKSRLPNLLVETYLFTIIPSTPRFVLSLSPREKEHNLFDRVDSYLSRRDAGWPWSSLGKSNGFLSENNELIHN